MLIREVLSSLAGAVGNPAYSFKDCSLKEWMGNGIKKEAGQPCRRSLPCHGEADESSTRQQRGIESICGTAPSWRQTLWDPVGGPWRGGGYERKVKPPPTPSVSLEPQSYVLSFAIPLPGSDIPQSQSPGL